MGTNFLASDFYFIQQRTSNILKFGAHVVFICHASLCNKAAVSVEGYCVWNELKNLLVCDPQSFTVWCPVFLCNHLQSHKYMIPGVLKICSGYKNCAVCSSLEVIEWLYKTLSILNTGPIDHQYRTFMVVCILFETSKFHSLFILMERTE